MTFGILSRFVFAIINILLRYKYAVPKYILNAVSVDIDLNEEIITQFYDVQAVGCDDVEQLADRIRRIDQHRLADHTIADDIDEVAVRLSLRMGSGSGAGHPSLERVAVRRTSRTGGHSGQNRTFTEFRALR